MLNKVTITLLAVAATALTVNAFVERGADDVDLGKPSAAVEYVAADTSPLLAGTFTGRSDHVTSGKVTLEKTVSGYQLRFAGDFFLDGAPDPIVAIGNNETYVASNKIGTLKKKTGSQVYELPAGFTPNQFSQVFVWCEQFSVPLGIAQLSNI